MNLHIATLLLAIINPLRCGAQIHIGEKVAVGVRSESAANYTILATRSSGLSSSLASEAIAYIDGRINTTAKFDFYTWNNYAYSNKIGVMAVCPTNTTDVSECAAFAEYNGELCGSASICPFEVGTTKKEVTADCKGINSDLPSCSLTCATFQSNNAAFDTCLTSSMGTPTSAPVGPTSFAPRTKVSSLHALPFIFAGGAMWTIWWV
jgi:hypothetical protein